MDLHREYLQFFDPLHQSLKKLETNFSDSLVLLSVFFETNPQISPSDIGKALSLPKDQVSQSLKRLENRHLIQRKICETGDKRKRSLQITTHGKKRASELVKVFDRQEELYENHRPQSY